MGTSENLQAWSKTASTNASADSSINWAEGQDPGSVNNSARSVMAAAKKYTEDRDGGLAAGGTGNAITLTTNQALSAGHIAAGLTLSFRATATNTGATTLNVDSTGAVSVVDQFGAALAAGAITSGGIYTVAYNANTSKWVLQTPAAITPAVKASFRAYLASDQAVTVNPTKVAWDSESFDVGSYFASSKWTPPAGTVLIGALIRFSAVTADAHCAVYIYKNGSVVASSPGHISSTISLGALLTHLDQADGDDYYEVYVGSTDAAVDILGGAIYSQFWGTMV